MVFGFLFLRIGHWINCCVCKNSSLPVSKGDEEDQIATPERIDALIKKCNYRAAKFRLVYQLVLFLEASMAIACAVIDNIQYRFIAAGVSLGLILISNLLSWPEYAEKLYVLADRIQDIKDSVDADETLTGRDRVRLKRLSEMAGSPLLYSDKKFQIDRAKSSIMFPLPNSPVR